MQQAATRTVLVWCGSVAAALLGAGLGCSDSPGSSGGGAAGAGLGGSPEGGAPDGSGGSGAGRSGASGQAGSATAGAGQMGGANQTAGANAGGEAGGALGNAGAGGESCAPLVTGQRPLDVLLLVDKSRFLDDPVQGAQSGTYFSEAVRGLGNFVDGADARGTGVAVSYFPLAGTPDACSADYSAPALNVSLLPGAAGAAKLSLGAQATNTEDLALTPALSGAIAHMKAWGQAHPDRKPVVVLLAGLAEIACDDWEDTYAAALAGFNGSPSVETHVISLLSDSSRSLSIASQSGVSPVIITSASPIGDQIEGALLALANPASACHIAYPAFEPYVAFEDNQVSLVYNANATGATVALQRVASVDDCADSTSSWYVDEALPKQLVACPATCAAFTGGYLTAQVACTP